MVLSLEKAEVYDIEVFPNLFTMSVEMLFSDVKMVWEISSFRDDRAYLLEHFRHLSATQTPMIGFNNVNYDYEILHFIWSNPQCSNQQIYNRSQEIIKSNGFYQKKVWASDRFAPQIDLFKIYHFDNKAKTTNLKALEINMRSDQVVESNLSFDDPVSMEDVDKEVIPYNTYDTAETKRFALHSLKAIQFRIDLIEQFGIDVLNWNDTKIGEHIIIKRLGDEVCYDRSSGKRRTRQTVRHQIALKDIIFPYVSFTNPEFHRIHQYMNTQVLQAEEFEGDDEGEVKYNLKTKGVFTDLTANVNGVEYSYGVGGIHGSVVSKKIFATDEYLIRDVDVTGLYPSIAIVNGLYPEHLGQRFIEVYSQIPIERKKWQQEKGKKCVEANALKLAANGAYGKSNSVFSPLYDPKFTMSITVNGQLLLSMLIERLLTVPTVSIIQANTDGVTYYIHKSQLEAAKAVEAQWQALTKLTLEDNHYSKMFIRDVNSYIAVGIDGSIKLKGAYWTPDPLNYYDSISEAQPPAWHKNLSNQVSIRAAVAHMVHGVDPALFIRMSTNPHDFVCAVKIRRSDKLVWGEKEMQRNTRFHVSKGGAPLSKFQPPKGKVGAYKKANGVDDQFYESVMRETGGQWDPRVCTKNKSKYTVEQKAIMAGYNVNICNNIADFNWSEINYDWYLQEAVKLII